MPQFRNHIGREGLGLGLPVYVGGSLEFGNVFERRGDIGLGTGLWAASLFIGIDTPLGPIYIGYGAAEGGNNSAYLFLGQTF